MREESFLFFNRARVVYCLLMALLVSFCVGMNGAEALTTVDSDEQELSIHFATGEQVDLTCKAQAGEKIWVFLEFPSLYPGLTFARPNDGYCEERQNYAFIFSQAGSLSIEAADLYYADAYSDTRIDFGINDFSGLGELIVTVKKGNSPDSLEDVQKIIFVEVERGKILSTSSLGNKSIAEIAAALSAYPLPFIPTYSVSLYKIVYETVDPAGRETVASGVVAVPQELTQPAPLVSYQHGTTVEREDVASVYGFDPINMALGSSGYVTSIPDFLGLGESSGLHPYVHAKSLATSVVDMLRAGKTFCRENNIPLNDQLFLIGYSEGGYATMAAHREIQENHGDEFTITASAPMAGPYDLSGVMAEQFLSDQPHSEPYYLPYTLLAYNDVYHLYDSINEMISEPYATTLPPLFDGEHSTEEINQAMPTIPGDIFDPDFIVDFQENANNPLKQALRENDLHNWVPQGPMRLYHCREDDLVPYENSEAAYNRFISNGAQNVELMPLNFGGHVNCGPYALFFGKLWFDSLL